MRNVSRGLLKMSKNKYKEVQKKSKKRYGSLYIPKGTQGTVIIDGIIYQDKGKGLKKLGIVVNDEAYVMPPQPLNKKEKRKMRADMPFLDKNRNLITPGEADEQ